MREVYSKHTRKTSNVQAMKDAFFRYPSSLILSLNILQITLHIFTIFNALEYGKELARSYKPEELQLKFMCVAVAARLDTS